MAGKNAIIKIVDGEKVLLITSANDNTDIRVTQVVYGTPTESIRKGAQDIIANNKTPDDLMEYYIKEGYDIIEQSDPHFANIVANILLRSLKTIDELSALIEDV